MLLGGQTGALADEPKSLPQDNFFSSVKQSLKQDVDHEVVRGHFDLGSPPNVHRYYCLVDPKTGRREPNGLVGDPAPHTGGMTGIKNSAVSLYRCADAERQGMLVTTGYVLSGPAAAALSTSPQAQTPAQAPATPAMALDMAATSLNQIDVGGVKLGMSPDQVRAVLKSKKLLEYNESAETLSYLDSAKSFVQPIPNGRFVNVVATWTSPPPSAAGDTFDVDGEFYAITFTPVPGNERAMGIVHTVGYSPANAIHETALESGLFKKYGGFSGPNDLPESPTWRFQSGGNVQVGDPCSRRGVFGGLGALNSANVAHGNLALKRTPEDFRLEIERCAAAIVTEDHFTANGGALREDRLVTRFTVTAYSPLLGLEGAKAAAQLIQAAGGRVTKPDASRATDPPASNL